MRDVYLYGALGERFGKKFSFSVDTIPETIQALRANFPEFTNAIRGGFYRVIVGKDTSHGIELEEVQLPGFRLGNQALHIIPVPEGAKRGGLGKIIAGIALIGLSVATGGAGGALAGQLWAGSTITGAQVAGSIGMSMLLTGVASMIAPEMESAEEEKSFTMAGPQGKTREGGIVPIAYGEVFTGGTLITGAITIDDERSAGETTVADSVLADGRIKETIQ